MFLQKLLFIISVSFLFMGCPAQVGVVVDKSALNTAISNATTLMNSKTVGAADGNVPQLAKDTYAAAIADTQTVATDASAPQAEVDPAVTALATATTVFNASVIGVDKSALNTAISNATTLMNGKTVGTAVGNVPQSAKDAYTAAIADAQAVANSTAATQATVNAAVATLATATTAFNAAIIGDNSTLTAAISAATTLMNSKTVGTEVGNVPQSAKDVYTSAIAAAQAVASNVYANQSEIDAAATALATATATFNVAVLSTIENTKYTLKMLFDCQQYYDSGANTYTAGFLAPPWDADLVHNHIPELTVGDPGYLEGAYIALKITTDGGGDTITVAALVLKNIADSEIRTILVNGTLGYLGAAGFIYISSNYFGYFFASAEHEYNTSVSYTVDKLSITKLSELQIIW